MIFVDHLQLYNESQIQSEVAWFFGHLFQEETKRVEAFLGPVWSRGKGQTCVMKYQTP